MLMLPVVPFLGLVWLFGFMTESTKELQSGRSRSSQQSLSLVSSQDLVWDICNKLRPIISVLSVIIPYSYILYNHKRAPKEMTDIGYDQYMVNSKQGTGHHSRPD